MGIPALVGRPLGVLEGGSGLEMSRPFLGVWSGVAASIGEVGGDGMG